MSTMRERPTLSVSMASCTLATCFKNEAPYLLEWIAFHRLAGFERIILFDNGSTDEGPALLAGLARAGVVELRRQPDPPDIGPQFHAYASALAMARSDWVVFLDLDEFLVLDGAEPVGAFLDRVAPDVSQVVFNWRCFGSSGRKEPGEGLVIERFLHAGDERDEVNRSIKSATRTRAIRAIHLHRPPVREGLVVHADGTPVRLDRRTAKTEAVRYGGGAVFHYAVKSRRELDAKMARGWALVPHGDPATLHEDSNRYFAAHDLNRVRLEVAAHRAAGVRDEMRRLEALRRRTTVRGFVSVALCRLCDLSARLRPLRRKARIFRDRPDLRSGYLQRIGAVAQEAAVSPLRPRPDGRPSSTP
ncbi:glycosyltransferase family 2 protein [Prosthecomicrobium sp. N25]|uniref:glycosyltransferase family 2 protein n=1 Tax=Prosthecomicrobium sp. N25 TaxID=3129254 RepID=UPI0030773E6E